MEWKLRKHPFLLEVNAWIWLARLSKKYGKKFTLSSIPAEELQRLARQGFDLIWLMGIWKRSPGARELAVAEPALRKHFSQILPGWSEDDIAGSPYAVHDYTVDPQCGTEQDLAPFKENLHKAGLGLMVDFVPNHLALDHPWTISNPEYFVQASGQEAKENPELFFKTRDGLYLAHGKDPHFGPWTDTVQINFFSHQARGAALRDLSQIAGVADGVRCDMSMLGLNKVFENVWGRFLKNTPRPQKEFWEEVIPPVKMKHPRFIFMAEAYWDSEWQLQQFGFDYTYDKKWYDRLRFSSASGVREYLQADFSYQERSVRFIENHDEPRAMSVLGREKSYAAAVLTATIPGMKLLHDGQWEGKKIHQTIQLATEVPEEEDAKTKGFYELLLEYAKEEPLHAGIWQQRDVTRAWRENDSAGNLLSWSWQKNNAVRLIAVNYSASQAQGRIQLPKEWLTGKNSSLRFRDRSTGGVYHRNLKELIELGLYVDLEPWKAHLFELNLPIKNEKT